MYSARCKYEASISIIPGSRLDRSTMTLAMSRARLARSGRLAAGQVLDRNLDGASKNDYNWFIFSTSNSRV